MKSEYLKWVTAWIAKEYKDFYRAGIKNLYTTDHLQSSYECTFTTYDNKPLPHDVIEEETLALIYEAIKDGKKFGDISVENTCVNDGTEFGKTYGCTRIILPVE